MKGVENVLRRMLSGVRLGALLGVAVLSFAACAPRGSLPLQPVPAAGGLEVGVLAVTNRELTDAGAPTIGRAETLSFFDVGVVLPPERPVGRLTWAGRGAVDPERHVTAREIALMPDEATFVSRLRRDLRARPPGTREVVVFVHGYNTNFAESTARLAQMIEDLSIPAVPLAFVWPSQETVTGYVHDRDSVLVSRPKLGDVLRLVREADPERVLLVAHSMGAQLSVEALLLSDLAMPGSAARLVDSVVLIAPDIGVDVFVSQIAQLSQLPKPFLVFTSARDRALRVSRWVSGNRERLGKPSADPRLPDLNVVFVDVTEFNDSTAGDFGHLTLGSSPALIALVPQMRDLARAFDTGAAATPGLLPGTLLSVRYASELVLVPQQTAP